VVLWQNVYTDANPVRQAELDLCHEINSSINSDKFDFVFKQVIERPTYNDIFRQTHGCFDCLNILANSDIYLNEQTIEALLNLFERLEGRKVALALSRWDVKSASDIELFYRPDSQDTWVFDGAIPIMEGADFYVGGVAGCDNKIAYIIKQNGYELFNPCKDIKTFHVHNSGVRNYISNGVVIDRVAPPYEFVHPIYAHEI
jgi:hypothetical protein